MVFFPFIIPLSIHCASLPFFFIYSIFYFCFFAVVPFKKNESPETQIPLNDETGTQLLHVIKTCLILGPIYTDPFSFETMFFSTQRYTLHLHDINMSMTFEKAFKSGVF